MPLDLERWTRVVNSADIDQCAKILLVLKQVLAVVEARLVLMRYKGLDSSPKLVTPSEAARLTGLTKRWFYAHQDGPWAFRPSPNRLLIDLEKLGRANGRKGDR